MRELFTKNAVLKSFLNGLDKKDERVLIVDIKGQQFYAGDRVIRSKTKDRSLLFVATGAFIAIDDTYPSQNRVFLPGSVIGMEQFLDNKEWEYDLICKQDGIIAKYSYSSFESQKGGNA